MARANAVDDALRRLGQLTPNVPPPVLQGAVESLVRQGRDPALITPVDIAGELQAGRRASTAGAPLPERLATDPNVERMGLPPGSTADDVAAHVDMMDPFPDPTGTQSFGGGMGQSIDAAAGLGPGTGSFSYTPGMSVEDGIRQLRENYFTPNTDFAIGPDALGPLSPENILRTPPNMLGSDPRVMRARYLQTRFDPSPPASGMDVAMAPPADQMIDAGLGGRFPATDVGVSGFPDLPHGMLLDDLPPSSVPDDLPPGFATDVGVSGFPDLPHGMLLDDLPPGSVLDDLPPGFLGDDMPTGASLEGVNRGDLPASAGAADVGGPAGSVTVDTLGTGYPDTLPTPRPRPPSPPPPLLGRPEMLGLGAMALGAGGLAMMGPDDVVFDSPIEMDDLPPGVDLAEEPEERPMQRPMQWPIAEEMLDEPPAEMPDALPDEMPLEVDGSPLAEEELVAAAVEEDLAAPPMRTPTYRDMMRAQRMAERSGLSVNDILANAGFTVEGENIARAAIRQQEVDRRSGARELITTAAGMAGAGRSFSPYIQQARELLAMSPEQRQQLYQYNNTFPQLELTYDRNGRPQYRVTRPGATPMDFSAQQAEQAGLSADREQRERESVRADETTREGMRVEREKIESTLRGQQNQIEADIRMQQTQLEAAEREGDANRAAESKREIARLEVEREEIAARREMNERDNETSRANNQNQFPPMDDPADVARRQEFVTTQKNVDAWLARRPPYRNRDAAVREVGRRFGLSRPNAERIVDEHYGPNHRWGR
jgi:hypothetical protein